MKFTKEQFSELEEHSIFCCDDISMDWDDKNVRMNVFNSLPNDIQGLAIQWGISDSVFRDDVFVHLVKSLYGLSTESYYENFRNYFDNDKSKNTKQFKDV